MSFDAPASRLNFVLEKLQRKFKLCFEELEIDGLRLELPSVANMPKVLEELDTCENINLLRELPLWAKVWPAYLVLARLLRTLDLRGKSLLEVGAGIGTAGLVAALGGPSRVVISDVNEDALLFAEAGILRNGLEDRAAVRRIDLCSDRLDERFDYILASEILYLEDIRRALPEFSARHLKADGKIIFCLDALRDVREFFASLAENFRIREYESGLRSRDEENGERRRYLVRVLEQRPQRSER